MGIRVRLVDNIKFIKLINANAHITLQDLYTVSALDAQHQLVTKYTVTQVHCNK